MKIYMTELLSRYKKKLPSDDLKWILPQTIVRIHNQIVSSLHKVINMSKLVRNGMNAYIESRLTINDPLKNTIKHLEEVVKNFYYLHRLLSSNQVIDQNGIRGEVKINNSDSISFYESLAGKQDMFPSMVGKIKEMESAEHQKYMENYIILEEGEREDNILQSDFEAFNLKFSPRTKRRIKRNQMQSSQLRKKNFHEKFYKKLLHGSQFFYLGDIDEDSATVSTTQTMIFTFSRTLEM